MLTKRIIPCLDVKNGRTVKGVNFKNLIDAGNPVKLAAKYADEGADELVFLDISATPQRRKTLSGLVRQIAREINIPFTVGGGVASCQDVEVLLKSGADKITVNSAAIINQELLYDLSKNFGNQCIVLAIDAKLKKGNWEVYISGGKIRTNLNLFAWAKIAEDLGAGEILFTAMNNDGTKNGFANDALSQLSKTVNIPIIASGGAGNINHFEEAFTLGNADAALAASVFHFDNINIPELKRSLIARNIPIRI
jgi:imidazole glycerol-phosphate synthase subunit HisF